MRGEAQMIPTDPNTPHHPHPMPHPQYFEPLNQGRDHKQPWQPVAITLAVVFVVLGTLWVTL